MHPNHTAPVPPQHVGESNRAATPTNVPPRGHGRPAPAAVPVSGRVTGRTKDAVLARLDVMLDRFDNKYHNDTYAQAVWGMNGFPPNPPIGRRYYIAVASGIVEAGHEDDV